MADPDTVDDASSRASLVGRLLDGRYQIDALLGEGGLGQVFRATDRRLVRPVAIKVMHSQHVARAELRARFEREARSLAALSHPNVVGVVDYGVDGDLPFLVMEFLEGRTLEAAMADGLPVTRVIPILRDVLRAVAYAHAQGVVHRDLKPANVFLQQVPEMGDVVRVLDFGLAKFIDSEPSGPTLTRAGMVLGTPAYMSPEQATAGDVDARADVYALGIVLFELAMGERPYRASDGPELLRQHLLKDLPPMAGTTADRAIRPELDALVRRATAKSRVDRFKDGAEMASALDALPVDAIKPIGDPVVKPRAKPTAAQAVATLGAPADATVASSPNELPAAGTIPNHPAPQVEIRAERRPAPPRSRFPKRALFVVAILALVSAIGIWLAGSSTPDPEPVATAPPTTTVAPRRGSGPTKQSEPQARVPETTGAPFDGPTPPQLVSIETRVRAGREITADQRRTLFRYSTNHPHDARAWLLMGHSDFNGGARTDACGRYEHAFHSDASARNDETMRHDLLVMSGHRAVHSTASRLVIEIYGARALPYLTAVEAELAGDREATRHLRTLRRRLEEAH